MNAHGTHWHHSPAHVLTARGIYFVTAGTYQKRHFFPEPQMLTYLHDELLKTATAFGWDLQAWAVFPNHYHFVGVSPENPETLRRLVKTLHGRTAREINKRDGVQGRTVWHEYWDTQLTYDHSYFARLHYTHANAVHHKLVNVPSAYPWCSAGRFELEAPRSFQDTVYQFPIDRLEIPDEY